MPNLAEIHLKCGIVAMHKEQCIDTDKQIWLLYIRYIK